MIYNNVSLLCAVLGTETYGAERLFCTNTSWVLAVLVDPHHQVPQNHSVLCTEMLSVAQWFLPQGTRERSFIHEWFAVLFTPWIATTQIQPDLLVFLQLHGQGGKITLCEHTHEDQLCLISVWNLVCHCHFFYQKVL